MDQDTFIQSRQNVRVRYDLTVFYGFKSDGGCVDVINRTAAAIYGVRDVSCSPYRAEFITGITSGGLSSFGCLVPVTTVPIAASLKCENGCHGNPILAPAREKVETAIDLAGSGPMPLEFKRVYRSLRARDERFWNNGDYINHNKSYLGSGWVHNHDIQLSYTTAEGDPASGERFEQVRIQTEDGSFHYFDRINSGAYLARQKLQQLTAQEDGYVFDDRQNERTYYFSKKGVLLRQVFRNGWYLEYFYELDLLRNKERLIMVANSFGQKIHLSYFSSNLVSVTGSDGRKVEFEYGENGLTTVRQADASTRRYIYGDGGAPRLLSGVMDENGVRYSSFSYDGDGWATATELANGVNRHEIVLTTRSGATVESRVKDPLGTVRVFNHFALNNDLKYYGADLPLAYEKSRPRRRTIFNSLGLDEIVTDLADVQDRTEWDTVRQLPIKHTEGYGYPEARTTSTVWSTQWRSPETVTEPGRVTRYTYDGSGNPLSQSVTDAATGTVRTTEWTYHPSKLVATQTESNGGVTSYAYDAEGNLTQTTNALGHLDTYTYDGAGRVLTHTAPNGLLTTYTYDPRGRIRTSNQGGQVTTLAYRPSGQVLTATLPHGHTITYSYDAAQRLTGWADNRGNSGSYVLDNMGNRLSEEVVNSQGQLAWKLSRSINNINRLASLTTGAGNAPTNYAYDRSGRLQTSTQAVNGSTIQNDYWRDALARVNYVGDQPNSWSQLVYNGLDAVTGVIDYNKVTTTYTRDALGNATSESSPDSGSKSTQYDALGLPASITNALGQATTITRDLLGRPTSITHSGGTTTLRYDQSPTSKGYLSEIEDASGTTTYQRDVHGRVVSQTQKLINNDTRTLAYSYHPTTGLLSSTTYPGGQVLQNVYDTTGQLTGLTWAGQPLVSGITWSPLGQPTGWSWSLPGGAAAIPASRSYNTAGQLTNTEFSSYTYDAAGRITSLTQSLMQPASTDAQANTVTQAPATWTVTYNRAGRITGFTKQVAAGNAANTVTYTYDANGNRTTSSQQRAGTTTNRTYTLTANRQTGFSQTQTGASTSNTSVSYQYNAAGDLLNDGLRTFQYDSQERLEKVTTGTGADAPSTQYAHNALGQRVFKTEPLFASGGSGSTTSGKNLNNLLADPEDQEEAEKEQDKGFIQTAYEFFTRLWSPGSSDAQKLGFAYVYGQDGTLLGEYGMGGSASSGTTQYIYLPTANGPMPIAAIVNGVAYAVHSDHLNTPRKLTQPDGQVAWQWAYSAFGDEQPTLGSKRFTDATTNPTTGATTIPEVTFNLRYPGQYYDKESGLHYNYFRSYSAERGRYTQADPIGLEGGFNRFGYVDANALNLIDPDGLVRLNPQALMTLEGGGGGAVLPPPQLPSRSGRSDIQSPPGSALVCRGGQCTADLFANGSGVSRSADGTLSGVSTQCRPGATVEELAARFKNNQVGVTTVDSIRAAGGRITLDGTPYNPNHATVDGLTARQLELLFTPVVKNPVPKDQRK
ncbi:RHS repeat-associated core domain-containing protein [Acidovorax soli]|nr:RHS repeat-associated core domain-containing protein [Acidovorax soli]